MSNKLPIWTAQLQLRRLFLALFHGPTVGQILPFHRFRVGCCPQANGVVVDVHPLVPLAIYLVRLGHHDFFNELVDDLRRQLRQPRYLSGPLDEFL